MFTTVYSPVQCVTAVLILLLLIFSHDILLWVSFSNSPDEIALIAGFPLFGPPWGNASCCCFIVLTPEYLNT